MTKPSTLPEFAVNPPNTGTPGEFPDDRIDSAEPPASVKDSGWIYLLAPPRAWDNWFKGLVSKWFSFLQDAPSAYENEFEAWDSLRLDDSATLISGDVCVVKGAELGGIQSPLRTLDIWTDTDSAITSLISTGPLLLAMGSGSGTRALRTHDGVEEGNTFAQSAGDIATDGRDFYIQLAGGSGDLVRRELIGKALKGTLSGIVGTIKAICTDGENVYFVDGGNTLRAYSVELGASSELWNVPFNANDVVNAIETDGRKIIVAHNNALTGTLINFTSLDIDGTNVVSFDVGAAGDDGTDLAFGPDGQVWLLTDGGTYRNVSKGAVIGTATWQEITRNAVSMVNNVIDVSNTHVALGQGSLAIVFEIPSVRETDFGVNETLEEALPDPITDVSLDDRRVFFGTSGAADQIRTGVLTQRPITYRVANPEDPNTVPSHRALIAQR